MGGIDILSCAVGAAAVACIAFMFWLAGDPDWRDALFDLDIYGEPFGDVSNVRELTAARNFRAGRKSAPSSGLTDRESHSHEGGV